MIYIIIGLLFMVGAIISGIISKIKGDDDYSEFVLAFGIFLILVIFLTMLTTEYTGDYIKLQEMFLRQKSLTKEEINYYNKKLFEIQKEKETFAYNFFGFLWLYPDGVMKLKRININED